MRVVLLLALSLFIGWQVSYAEELSPAEAEKAAAEEAAAAEGEHYVPAAGEIGFIEIPSLNLDESQEFYGNLFGWQFQPMDETELMFVGPGVTMGAFNTQNAVAADGGIIFYIAVESVDATLAAAEAAGGGIVLPKMQLPEDWGFIGQLSDPHGNVIGLWSAY
jgi:predicted enzyme related to lactoylglutathione lyase